MSDEGRRILFLKVENIFVAKDPASGKVTDVEKGEARASNGSSHFQFHNIDLQRASSKGSVLSSAGKVLLKTRTKRKDFIWKKALLRVL